MSAVFRVPTRDSGDVFMSIRRPAHVDDERVVVEIDAEKFLALWRHAPKGRQSDLAHGTPDTWKADYKYQKAAEGFALGLNNPVPLAELNCCIRQEKVPYVSFTNGITRTIWLLAQGATLFPIKTTLSQAERMQRLAGVPGGSYKTVNELTRQAGS